MSERKSANAYRTISEVAESLGVPQHVLRFWETKFPAVKPLKRGGNRRYYRPEDIELLQVIHRLLHVDGYTIKGAQKLLKDRGVRTLVAELLGSAPAPDAAGAAAEAEAEAALAEAGIPEALTREPDTAPAPVPSEEPAPAGAAMPAVAPVAFAPPASLTDAASAPAVAAPKTDANTAALVRELKSIRARLAAALA